MSASWIGEVQVGPGVNFSGWLVVGWWWFGLVDFFFEQYIGSFNQLFHWPKSMAPEINNRAEELPQALPMHISEIPQGETLLSLKKPWI